MRVSGVAALAALLAIVRASVVWPEIVPASDRCLHMVLRFDSDRTGTVECSHLNGRDLEWRPYYRDVIASESAAVGSNTSYACLPSKWPSMAEMPGQLFLTCATDNSQSAGHLAIAWHPLDESFGRAGAQGTNTFVVLWEYSEPGQLQAGLAAKARAPQLVQVDFKECVVVAADFRLQPRDDQPPQKFYFCPSRQGFPSTPRNRDPMAPRGAALYVPRETNSHFESAYDASLTGPNAPRVGIRRQLMRFRNALHEFSGTTI